MKVEKLDERKMQIEGFERQIKELNTKIELTESLMPKLERELELSKIQFEIDKQASDIIIAKYDKLIFNFEYEKDDTYQTLMKEKQQILSEMSLMKSEMDLKSKEMKIQDLKEGLEQHKFLVKEKQNQIDKLRNEMGEMNE